MNVTIRPAEPLDSPAIAEIHARSWEVAYKDIIPAEYIREKNATRPALWKRIMTSIDDRHYVIQLDGKTVGFLDVALPDPDAENASDIDDSFFELHGLYLHPDFYLMGIGTTAMKFAFDKARSEGKRNLLLWVFADNRNSIQFYEKCGFDADGASKTLHCGKDLTAIRMRSSIVSRKCSRFYNGHRGFVACEDCRQYHSC